MDNHASIRKDNRKALPKYLLLILCAALVGAALGFLAGFAGSQNLEEAAAAALDHFLEAVTPWGIPVSTLVLLSLSWSKYRSANKLFSGWDGEDEGTADRVEQALNWALLLTTLQFLLDLFFFSAAVVYWVPGRLTILVEIGCFLVSIALLIVTQQKVVDLTRRLNPEKQGSVYDLKFRKKWLSSCDEAEQKQIGQAAYKACHTLNVACPILWCGSILLSFTAEASLLPSFLILLLWGLLSLTYIMECIRMSKKAPPRQPADPGQV